MFRILACASAFPLLIACGAKTDPAGTADKAPAGAPAAASPFPGFDAKAELALLNGKWNVTASMNQKEVWTVKDGAVTIVNGDKTSESTLQMDYPGHIKVVTKNGASSSSSIYSYTHDGDTIYLGLGDGGLKIGDVYYGGASNGVTILSGTDCKFYGTEMSFGGEGARFKAPVDVVCAVEGNTFKYQVAKFAKAGEFDDKSLEIVGTALLSPQLKGNAITKAE